MDLRARYHRDIQDNFGIIRKVVGMYVDHPADREDLQQEILLQAWRSYESFDGRSKFSTWLYRVSLNTVLTFMRRRQAPVQAVEELPEPAAGAHDDGDDRTEQLYRAIRALPEAERAIILPHLDGYDNGEIAEITGLTKNHVAVKLHRIKQDLITRLKQQSHGPTTRMG